MKSLRVKAWFRTTPQFVVINSIRAKNLGAKNLAKLTKASRKHKTSIVIESENSAVFFVM